VRRSNQVILDAEKEKGLYVSQGSFVISILERTPTQDQEVNANHSMLPRLGQEKQAQNDSAIIFSN